MNPQWILAAFALLSFGISLATLYKTHLSPFRLGLSVGKPGWRLENVEDTAGHRAAQILTLTLPIEFTNLGAQGGPLEDILVEVTRNGGTTYFTPTYYADPAKYSEGLAQQLSSLALSESGFQPLFLLGREHMSKVIVFSPRQPDARLVPGNYLIHLHIRAPQSRRGIQWIKHTVRAPQLQWIKHTVGTFVIVSGHITELEQGTMVEIASEETRKERAQAIRS